MKIIKLFEIIDTAPNPICTYGEYRYVRDKYNMNHDDKCFACGHQFSDNDDVYYASAHVDDINKNVILCSHCNCLALKSGNKKK